MGPDNVFGVHGAALQLRSQRLTMLASNIANAATPNYKARDFDFSEALKMATGDGDTMTGTAGAGAFGSFPLTGTRA